MPWEMMLQTGKVPSRTVSLRYELSTVQGTPRVKRKRVLVSRGPKSSPELALVESVICPVGSTIFKFVRRYSCHMSH